MTNSEQSQSLNVLLLPEDFHPKESGGAFIDWNVARHLAKEGESVTVITPRNGNIPQVETVEEVEIRRPFRGSPRGTHPNSLKGIFYRLLFLVYVVPYLFYLFWKRGFDIVYSTNHLLHMPATMVSLFFRSTHISFVGYSPTIQVETKRTNPFILLEWVNVRLFMGEVALCRTPSVYEILSEKSSAEVSQLSGILDKKAIIAAHESPTSLDENLPGSAGVRLAFVGRLVEVKNPYKLPALVARLPEKYSLVMVGDGPQRAAVESAVQEADVGNRVHLLGRLPHQKTLQVIRQSDLLIVASSAESYGAVAFEALALNTPVLATPVGVLSTVDHPSLTIAQFDDFQSIIQTLQLESSDGIDEEILEMYSVNQFAQDVHSHMLNATEFK